MPGAQTPLPPGAGRQPRGFGLAIGDDAGKRLAAAEFGTRTRGLFLADDAQQFVESRLARGTLKEGEETCLDALSDLVGSYEDEHHAIEPASDADMLRHLMEARGLNQYGPLISPLIVSYSTC